MVAMLSSLYPLLQPALRFVDPERAHDLAIAALARLPLPAPAPDDPRLALTAFGLRFPNPIGIAAGFDKGARVAEPLRRLGFGFVEVGGVTLRPQPGNPRPRVFRLLRDQAIINRYGLNSEGAEIVAARLGRLRRTGILGINLGANKESADRLGDYVALIRRLGPLADFVTLNISSPNTPGLRDLQGRAFLDELIARVVDARAEDNLRTRILVKIAPDLGLAELDDIVAVARGRSVDGMIVSNTSVARPRDLREKGVAREAGGLSGRPLFRPSTILLAQAFQRVAGAFPLIGVGGILSGEDAVAKLAAGASLVQVYSGFVYRGPALIEEIKARLLAAIEREGVGSVAALVGRNAATWAEAGA